MPPTSTTPLNTMTFLSVPLRGLPWPGNPWFARLKPCASHEGLTSMTLAQ